MSRKSKAVKRVRIYLDIQDSDQASILQHLEAIDDLSLSDRNQWLLSALMDYQAKLLSPSFKPANLGEMRHQMVAMFLNGRAPSVEDLAQSVVPVPAPEYLDERRPATQPSVSRPQDGNREQSSVSDDKGRKPEQSILESSDSLQESMPVEPSHQEVSDPSSNDSPLFRRLGNLM